MGSIVDGITGKPTQPVRLPSLIERLKRAEPDRELDALIWLSVVPGTSRKFLSYIHQTSGRNCEIDETRELQPDGSRRLVVVPKYTESVDAALMLIPKGYVWRCGFSHHVPYVAAVSSSRQFAGQFIGECDSTPAIALCIAAISAIDAIRTSAHVAPDTADDRGALDADKPLTGNVPL
jgi:hypothetical protein